MTGKPHQSNKPFVDITNDANLCDASLCDADLRSANLRRANLRRANLRRANLCDADLRGADLRDADLYRANLCRADLCDANLRGANLYNANLYRANLCDADLCDANLRGANLPALTIAQLSIVAAGDLVVWKKLAYGIICKLSIPADARRSNATGRKCRASHAIVLEGEGVSLCDSTFSYRVGERVEPREPFNEDRWNECASGIHFFLTREEAEAYY
jgi:uncharacterized protein DUF5758/pentapeptide repeat protein